MYFEGFMNIFIIRDIIVYTDESVEMFSSYYAYIHLLLRVCLYILLIIFTCDKNVQEDIESHRKYYPIIAGLKTHYKMDHIYELIQYFLYFAMGVFIASYGEDRTFLVICLMACFLALSAVLVIFRPWRFSVLNYFDMSCNIIISITLCIIIIDHQDSKCNLC